MSVNDTSTQDDTPHMTDAQRETLRDLCKRYRVPFRESDYAVSKGGLGSPPAGSKDGLEGWGQPSTLASTRRAGRTPDELLEIAVRGYTLPHRRSAVLDH